MVRWRLLASALLLLAAIGSIYAYRAAHTPVVLTVGLMAESNWEVPDGESYVTADAAIARFRERHPDVEVRYVSGIRNADYSEWLAERLLSGDEPDVFVVPGTDFDLYARSGALVDLTPIGTRDLDFSWDDYYGAALDYGRLEGHSYALPVGAVATLMFVNKTLLTREGIAVPEGDWTWQDFFTICEQVTRDTDGDGAIDQFGVYDYGWEIAAVTNGAQLFSEDGHASYFASPEMEETVHFLLALHALQHGREVTARDFDSGRVAFRPFTYAEYSTYKPYPWRIKKYTGFEWDCIRLPAGPSGASVSELDTLLMGVSARSKHQQLAWELLKELAYTSEGQELILSSTQALPVRRDVVARAAEVGASEINLATVSEVMDTAVARPRFARYEGAMLRASVTLERLVRGEQPLNNALNRLQKEINSYLQE